MLRRTGESVSIYTGGDGGPAFAGEPRRAGNAQENAYEGRTGRTRIADIQGFLKKLCKTPEFDSREVGTPGYDRCAAWVAGELASFGLEPFGAEEGEKRSWFAPFRWVERFGLNPVTRSKNVIGILRGTDPEPREAVLVIAHLDNLSRAEKTDYVQREGRKYSSYEGANDNAAAVAAALEAAKTLAASGPIKRDIVFLFPSAEEEGLKGTEAFCMKPPIPLDRFVGVVNLEMIGQNDVSEILVYGGDSRDEEDRNPLFARTFETAEKAGISVKRGIDHDDGQHWYGRSDHFVTRNAGIPSIMIHGRTDAGHYHTEDDTIQKLNLPKIDVVSALTAQIARSLGDDPSPREHREQARAQLNNYSGAVYPE
jgi:hypothetical protein